MSCGQINYSVKSETGIFGFSTNIELVPIDHALMYRGLGVSRITGGSGTWQIGAELCRVKEGDLVFLSNLEPRQTMSGSFTLEAFAIGTNTLTNAGALDCLRVYYGRRQSFTHVIQSDKLVRIHDAIREEITSPAPSFSLILAYAIELLIGAGRLYDERFPDALDQQFRCKDQQFRCDSTTFGAIAASAAYINENLTADLRVEELAKLAGMSEGHYTRMFRKYVFVTPVDYIARCRVKRFLTLYSESKGNVLDTAFACGFTSASGFYKAFRRICGHAPTEEVYVGSDS